MNMYQHEDDPKEEEKQEERCGNCKFFCMTKGSGGWGRCQRHPPSRVEGQGNYEQPATRGEWWCGEWKPG